MRINDSGNRNTNFSLTCIFLAIFCIPRNYDAFPGICQILRIIEMPGLAWSLILFFKNKYYKVRWYIPFYLLLVYMFICMRINDPIHTKDCNILIYRMFSVTVLSEYMFRLDRKRAVTSIGRIWAVMMFIEVYSLITGCFGYAKSTVSSNHNFFFGIRVEINEYIIYTFSFVCYAMYAGKSLDKFLAYVTMIGGLYFVFNQAVSTSVVGCFVFFMIILFGRVMRSKRMWRNIIITAAIISVTFAFIQNTSAFDWLLSDILGEDLTMNGRTLLWSQAIGQMRGIHLLFGYGYSPDFTLKLTGTFVANHPHNQYLQMMYNYGIPGMILYLCMMFKMVKVITRIPNSNVRIIHIATLTATIFMCITSRNYLYLTAQIYYASVLHLKEF